MASLKNYTKIGQGILLGVDVTLGGYAYHELLVNLYIGIIIALFALVIAIIAFAPEEYSVVKDTENAMKKYVMPSDSAHEMERNATIEFLTKLSNWLKEYEKIDAEVGKSGSPVTLLINKMKADASLKTTLQNIFNSKSISAADVKSLEPLISDIITVLQGMGVNIKPAQNALPIIETALSSPEVLNIINNVLKSL